MIERNQVFGAYRVLDRFSRPEEVEELLEPGEAVGMYRQWASHGRDRLAVTAHVARLFGWAGRRGDESELRARVDRVCALLARGDLRIVYQPNRAIAVEAPAKPEPIGPTPEPEKVLADFTVRLLDELGKPLDGLSTRFELEDRKVDATTDGDGKGAVHEDPASIASVRLADEDALRKKLYDRWKSARGEEWLVPDAGDAVTVHELRRAEDVPSFSVSADEVRTVVFQPRVVQARLLGMWFDTSKSFLLPTARKTLPQLARLYAENPESDLLVVGHTDRAGDASYNDPLSVERAESIAAFLRDDVDAWYAWYGAGKSWEKRWGSKEDDYMINAVAEQNGEVPTGWSRVAWYQSTRGISPANGVADENTRRKLIEEYMSLDGTSVPDDIVVSVHGCGENFPIDDAPDGASSLEDRRVELFFFENPMRTPDRPSAVLPAPAGKNSKPKSKEYPEWVLRAKETHDFFPGQEEELRSHISIVLTGAGGGVPIADRDYRIHLDSGVVLEGRTKSDGFLEHKRVPPGDYTLEVDGHSTIVPTVPETVTRRLQWVASYFG